MQFYVAFYLNKKKPLEIRTSRKLELPQEQSGSNLRACTVPAFFNKFKVRVENETGRKMKCLRTDNGTEYCNKQLTTMLIKSGIRHQTTVPYSPQQNGVAERMNRTMVERARCMLFHCGLPKKFWAEAVANAVYVINRSVSAAIAKNIPQQKWSDDKINLSNLRIFGCRAVAYVPKEKRKKWDSKTKEYIFVGYCEDTKGYRLLESDSLRLIKSRDVTFFENDFQRKSQKSHSEDFSFYDGYGTNDAGEDVEDSTNSISTDSVSTDSENSVGFPIEIESDGSLEYFEPDETLTTEDNRSEPGLTCNDNNVRRSARTPKPVNMFDYHLYLVEAGGVGDPLTVEEALNGDDGKQWRQAMDNEYKSLMENNTWTLVELPSGAKPIKSKWVFKKKRDENGDVQRYKARLVIKGCSQKPGIDFQETYSPVVRYTLSFVSGSQIQFRH